MKRPAARKMTALVEKLPMVGAALMLDDRAQGRQLKGAWERAKGTSHRLAQETPIRGEAAGGVLEVSGPANDPGRNTQEAHGFRGNEKKGVLSDEEKPPRAGKVYEDKVRAVMELLELELRQGLAPFSYTDEMPITNVGSYDVGAYLDFVFWVNGLVIIIDCDEQFHRYQWAGDKLRRAQVN
eukprot:gene7822-1021_t